jgi:AraC-like DNA-binding protein
MLNLIATLTAGSAIFLAFLVVAVRQDANVAANRWLGVFLSLLGLFMLDDSLLSEKHRHLSMVGIAFEAGFNSKTAFNTAFKKQVGVSPTAFREGITS